jgi:hypothetical protein
MPVKRVKEEITLNQSTSGVVLADGVANIDSEIISYTVPDKSAIRLRPTDTLDMYLADSTPTELAGTSQVTLYVTDALGRRREVILQAPYEKLKETRDKMLIQYLRKDYVAEADQIIKISVVGNLAVDDAQTRFNLTCLLGYETLA